MLAGVKLFVMTGTNGALGHIFRISGRDYPCKRLPLDETHPGDIEESYSFTKVVCEQMLDLYTRAYGMRTYVLRCAGLWDEAARRRLAEKAGPVEKWDWGVWAWVAREDAASAHRMVMEKAASLPAHDVFFCNADDTSALEPTRELVERLRPDLVPLIAEPLEGNASLISNRKLREAVGWEPRTGWRQYLEK
jgi:nucleoside-diphosphate-sugar epimerase